MLQLKVKMYALRKKVALFYSNVEKCSRCIYYHILPHNSFSKSDPSLYCNIVYESGPHMNDTMTIDTNTPTLNDVRGFYCSIGNDQRQFLIVHYAGGRNK